MTLATGRECLTQAQELQRKAIAAAKYNTDQAIIQAYAMIKEETLAKDPDHIFYKLQHAHIKLAIELVLDGGLEPKQALVAVSNFATKHEPTHIADDWLNTVMHRDYMMKPELVKMGLEGANDGSQEVMARMKKQDVFKEKELVESSTFSRMTNELHSQRSTLERIESIEAQNKDQELRIQALEAQMAKASGKIEGIISGDIEIATWKEQAISLKKQGHNNTFISKVIGKGRQSVSTYLNTDEAKSLLEQA